MARTPLTLDAVYDYFFAKAPVLFLALTKEGEIVTTNQYTSDLIGPPLNGKSISDVIIDFNGKFELAKAIEDPSHELMLSVGVSNGPPQTFYFSFESVGDYILVFGRQDAEELEIMRREVLSLNQEQGNLMRKLHKTNAQLIQKEKALSQSLSDLKLAQTKLVESEKMASLGRLVAGFAHEINTPIGIALTATSSILESSQQIDMMLGQEEVEEDELVSALETIRDASKLVYSNLNRSADLVGSFKRTSIDQSVDDLHVYSLNDTITDALTSMRIKIKDLPIEADFDSHEETYLFGTPGDMFQLISNLFENSVLHGFEKGEREGTISVSVRKKDQHVLIRYADTGKGMSDEVAKRIFEPFYTTLRARGGTGLGMYICHNIVTSRLKGTITCSCPTGGGAEFLITVPIHSEETHEAEKIKES